MSFVDCINAQNLTDAQKRAVIKQFKELEADFQAKHGPGGSAIASTHMAKLAQSEFQRQAQNLLRDVQAWDVVKGRIEREAATFEAMKKMAARRSVTGLYKLAFGHAQTVAARRLLERVDNAHDAIKNRYLREIADVVERFRSKGAGFVQDVNGFALVNRAIHDQKFQAEHGEFAKELHKVYQSLKKEYEAVGGIMGKIKNFIPQRWNPDRVYQNAPDFETFYADFKDRVDLSKMEDFETGAPLSPKKFQNILRKVHKSIISEGVSDIAERIDLAKPLFGDKQGFSMKRAHRRFFRFKAFDDYAFLNEKYGGGAAMYFNDMVNHVDNMARDIAIMKEMGPNPSAQLRRIKAWALSNGANTQGMAHIDQTYDAVTERLNWAGRTGAAYNAYMGSRNWVKAVVLGFSSVLTVSDTVPTAMTAKMQGLEATKALGRLGKLMNPADAGDRELAKQMISVIGSVHGVSIRAAFSSRGIKVARGFSDEGMAQGVPGAVLDSTLRLNGLSRITDLVGQALPMEWAATFARLKSTGKNIDGSTKTETTGKNVRMLREDVRWEDLNPQMRTTLEHFEISKADYQKILATQVFEDPTTGGKFIFTDAVRKGGNPDIAYKLELLNAESTKMATTLPRAFVRGKAIGSYRAGTWERALWGTLWDLKSFPTTIMLNHMLPHLQQGLASGNFGMLGAYAAGMTFTGGIALTATSLLTGNTLPDFTKPQTWAASMAFGGWAGLLGDIILPRSTMPNALASLVLGPTGGAANSLYDLAIAAGKKATGEQDSNLTREAFQFTKYNALPYWKVFYTRLLVERMFLDQIERMVDPDFDSRRRRMERKQEETKGTKPWWRKGEMLPESLSE
jgi:hypothetical protein